MKTIECDWCEGTGDVGMYSCCGDDMSMNDIGICPSCGEHWAYEKAPCENCGGDKTIQVPETPEEKEEEIKRNTARAEERKKRMAKWTKIPVK